MARGGKREGAGRKQGAVAKVTAAARAKAATTGELPHEFLLRVVRGEDSFADSKMEDGERVETVRLPTFAERLDAAKAAAPYFAPRLASANVQHGGVVGVLDVAASVPPDARQRIAMEMLREDGYEFDE